LFRHHIALISLDAECERRQVCGTRLQRPVGERRGAGYSSSPEHGMNTKLHKKKWIAAITLSGAVSLAASCQTMSMGGGEQVSLTGASEVPAVATSASGSATVTIKHDRSVAAKITITGMTPTAAHIHEAAAGSNGAVIVPFTKTGDNTFEAPAAAKLTEAQYASYKAGKLYVNLHSAAHSGGEIRVQLKAS
jgi:hypothetical protein